MLSLAMALEISPRFLLLDEPSLGLAPNLVRGMFSKLQALNTETGARSDSRAEGREILGLRIEFTYCAMALSLTLAQPPY